MLNSRSTLSAFSQTTLHEQLQAAGIEHLVMAGPYANLALDSTVRDGVQLGYHMTFLRDCATAASEAEAQAVQVTMPRYAQTVIDLSTFESFI